MGYNGHTIRRLLQANINHSARAQDLFMQTLTEWGIELVVMAEPYYVPEARSDWLGDDSGLVASCMPESWCDERPPLYRSRKGRGLRRS